MEYKYRIIINDFDNYFEAKLIAGMFTQFVICHPVSIQKYNPDAIPI